MLQFITHKTESCGILESTLKVLEGGCRWVQLRMKGAPDDEVVSIGLKMRKLCSEYGATFILDDHVDLVRETGADGVHLGKSDMPLPQARAFLGPEKIIGATANTFEDIFLSCKSGADYIGLGPFRFTTTKSNLSPIIGLEGYGEIMRRCREAGIGVPVVAIGGILAEDVPDIMATGVTGIAISGALINADDTAAQTRRVLGLMGQGSGEDALGHRA